MTDPRLASQLTPGAHASGAKPETRILKAKFCGVPVDIDFMLGAAGRDAAILSLIIPGIRTGTIRIGRDDLEHIGVMVRRALSDMEQMPVAR